MPYRRSGDQQIFRFEVFVTSKQLGEALALLTNRVTQITPPQLVTNATKKGKRLTAATGGTLLEMFAEHLRKTKPEDFQKQYVKDWMAETGAGNPNSSTYLLNQALKRKLVKKLGKAKGPGHPQHYTVAPASPAKE